MSKQLSFSDLNYRRVFETTQDGILIVDAYTGKIVDANPLLMKMLGHNQHNLVGKEVWNMGFFKDMVGFKESFLKNQKTGYIRYKDLPMLTQNGQKFDIELIRQVYMVGKQKMIQCNIRDITHRQKADQLEKSRTKELENLSKSQEETKQAMLNVMEDLEAAKSLIEFEKVKDEAMLASIGEGLVAVDNDRKIMVMNKAAENMLGWKMKEMIGKEITSLPLEDEEGHLMPLNNRPTYLALTTGKVVSETYYFVRKDKTRFPIAINVTPIKLEGKIIGAVDIFRDITNEKEIDRAKSEFVSLASHQLRTPLGISKWYIEAIMTSNYIKEAPPIIKEYLDEVYKSNERLLLLVRDLLLISRIDQRKIASVSKRVNIISVIKNVMKEMRILAQSTLQLKVKSTVKVFYTDPLRVQEVIENLLSNAITYSHPSAVVQIILDQKDDQCVLSFKDTGIGISKEDKKKLFTKFFRSEKAMVKNAEGSGLGLYVVKSYVEGWGGEIFVESTLGHGSTFSILLPDSTKKLIKQ